jgi:hypothetical protein
MSADPVPVQHFRVVIGLGVTVLPFSEILSIYRYVGESAGH